MTGRANRRGIKKRGTAVLALAAILLSGLLAPPVAKAVRPDEVLPNAKLELRARALSKRLRCLVCQNESIDDSEADLAHDLRVLVRKRLKAGDSDQQVLDFLVARYGDFVLLKPPVKPSTWLLWFGPFAVLGAAALGILIAVVRRRKMAVAAPAPLDEAERAALARILRQEEPLGTGTSGGGADGTVNPGGGRTDGEAR